jgi:hypothetical protein
VDRSQVSEIKRVLVEVDEAKRAGRIYGPKYKSKSSVAARSSASAGPPLALLPGPPTPTMATDEKKKKSLKSKESVAVVL